MNGVRGSLGIMSSKSGLSGHEWALSRRLLGSLGDSDLVAKVMDASSVHMGTCGLQSWGRHDMTRKAFHPLFGPVSFFHRIRVLEVDLADVRSHIVENVVIVGTRMRRRRMREGDVVSTEVITVEAILLIHGCGLFGSQLVLRLPYCSVGLNKGHLLVGGLSECNFLATNFALSAVLSYHEEVLNLFADDRELGLADGLLPAGEIIVTENHDLLVLLVLGEHRVNQEDRRQESLPGWHN